MFSSANNITQKEVFELDIENLKEAEKILDEIIGIKEKIECEEKQFEINYAKKFIFEEKDNLVFNLKLLPTGKKFLTFNRIILDCY